MIKRILVKNFQSHTRTELRLHKNVNCIIGQSDSGKTAIFRALNWLLTNRPGGDSFRREGSEETSAEIHLDNDTRIKRTKYKKTSNEYKIKDTKGNIQEFKAFGQSVPEEVQTLCNIEPINYQLQHDSPFLLSETAGEVAKRLNTITKLDKIDSSLSFVNSKIRKIEQDKNYTESAVKELQEELSKYDYLDEMKKDLDCLEALDISVLMKTKSVGIIDTAIKHATTLYNQSQSLNDIIRAKDDLNSIEAIVERKTAIVERIERLREIGRSISQKKQMIARFEALLDLKAPMTNCSAMENEISWLTEIIAKVEDSKNLSKTLSDKIGDLKLKMPEVCPLCGSEMK